MGDGDGGWRGERKRELMKRNEEEKKRRVE